MTATEVAFVADTHDRTHVVRAMVRTIRERGAEVVVHLGDVCTPETLAEFGEFEVHWITGNGDQPYKDELNEVVESIGGEYHQWGDSFVFGTKRFYCRHGMEHDVSYTLAAEKNYDYVFHGHWHNQERTEIGSSAVLNPGNDGVYFYDPDADSFEWVEVED